jgi:hypothetical protein
MQTDNWPGFQVGVEGSSHLRRKEIRRSLAKAQSSQRKNARSTKTILGALAYARAHLRLMQRSSFRPRTADRRLSFQSVLMFAPFEELPLPNPPPPGREPEREVSTVSSSFFPSHRLRTTDHRLLCAIDCRFRTANFILIPSPARRGGLGRGQPVGPKPCIPNETTDYAHSDRTRDKHLSLELHLLPLASFAPFARYSFLPCISATALRWAI